MMRWRNLFVYLLCSHGTGLGDWLFFSVNSFVYAFSEWLTSYALTTFQTALCLNDIVRV
jgi:hypothetical protein